MIAPVKTNRLPNRTRAADVSSEILRSTRTTADALAVTVTVGDAAEVGGGLTGCPGEIVTVDPGVDGKMPPGWSVDPGKVGAPAGGVGVGVGDAVLGGEVGV